MVCSIMKPSFSDCESVEDSLPFFTTWGGFLGGFLRLTITSFLVLGSVVGSEAEVLASERGSVASVGCLLLLVVWLDRRLASCGMVGW